MQLYDNTKNKIIVISSVNLVQDTRVKSERNMLNMNMINNEQVTYWRELNVLKA